jgi:hypothetical protein
VSEARTKLVKAIAKSRLWLVEVVVGAVRDTDQLALRENVSGRSIRTLLTLVKAAVDGRLPRGFGVDCRGVLVRRRDLEKAASKASPCVTVTGEGQKKGGPKAVL